MIYGLYVSATGVLANSYRQDVIANNLANVETVGFKKDLARFVEQRTAVRIRGLNAARHSDPALEPLGGGLSFAPTELDLSQGDMESTGGAADVAIHGDGFFALRGPDGLVLSRDGRFYVNREGRLARLTGGEEVLDQNQKSILLDPNVPVKIGANGIVSQRGVEMGRIGIFDVPQRNLLVKRGKGVFEYPNAAKQMRPGRGEIRNGMLERANVDPMSEMALMMETLRQLEANANMIRYQDQMLSRAVNDVGKIS